MTLAAFFAMVVAFTGVEMFKSQTTPAWFRYTVPSNSAGNHNCYNSGPVVHLEPSKELIVLIRVENGQIGKVRSYSGYCQIDADGVPVIELTGVTPAASIALLDSLLPSHKSALVAISLHADPAADAYLLKTAKSGATPDARGQALFWLANRAGRMAAPAIREAIDEDPEFKVKERAVFALSQLPKDEGIPLLIDVAKNNRSPQVRRKAMFWLGQSKDPRALKFFEELLTR